nr:MAG TPA: hypothetical protein [Caudoviricetes sp.]
MSSCSHAGVGVRPWNAASRSSAPHTFSCS